MDMIFSIQALYLVFAAVILTSLFLYMQKRLAILIDEQKRHVYAPNTLRSLIEILIFLGVYFACGVLATATDLNLDVAAGGALFALVLSLFLVNKTVYKNLGKYTFVYATLLMTVYYIAVAYINTTI